MNRRGDELKESNLNISFDGYYEVNNTIYMSSCSINGLLELDSKSRITKRVRRFDNGSLLSQLLHHNVIEVGDEVVFIPHFSFFLHIYNRCTDEIRTVKIKKDEWTRFRCVDSVVINNKLWLITSYLENGIISIDLGTYEVVYYDEFYSKLRVYLKDIEPIFWTRLSIKNHILYGAFDDKGYIIKIDLETLTLDMIDMGSDRHFADIAVEKGVIYLTEYFSKHVFSYHINEEKQELILMNGHCEECEKTVYSNIIACDNFLILIPEFGRDIWAIEHSNIKKIGELPVDFIDNDDFRRGWKRFYNYEIKDFKLYLYPNKANMMIVIDLENFRIDGYKFLMNQEWINDNYEKEYFFKYIEEAHQNGDFLVENDRVDLELWLKSLCNKEA